MHPGSGCTRAHVRVRRLQQSWEQPEPYIEAMPDDTQKPLELRFAGQLVEQLGAQLYPRVTASVAELISNGWDADAKHVWITIPFDRKWDESAVIEVLDDGHGMTYEQAQERYLIVGRNRRRWDGATSEAGRALHGRKGIGKLAAFGTAGHLELVTVRDGETTAFVIDYEKLRRLAPTTPYTAERIDNPDPLIDPVKGEPLEHGTRVRLSRLRAKRRAGKDEFRRSMARRFALDATEMQVFINKEPLTRFDYDATVRFPRDARPPNAIELTVDANGWGSERIDVTPLVKARRERLKRKLAEEATERTEAREAGEGAENQEGQEGVKQADAAELGSGDEEGEAAAASGKSDAKDEDLELDVPTLREDNTVEIRWWIGFTEKPIPDEDVRGVSILARGKLAQRPFMFEMAQGTESQLLQEYLVGEVQADWLDFGRDADDDLIQSNRDQLQLDNDELQPLLTWGRERLRWAMAEQGRRRRARRAGPDALGKEVERAIEKAPAKTRARFRTLAARIADLTDDPTAVARAVDAVVSSSEVAQVDKARAELQLEGDPDEAVTWELLARASEAARDLSASLLETRSDALKHFGEALREPPVEGLHRRVVSDPWIISPVLELLPREVVEETDQVAVVRFAGLEQLVPPWTLIAFAVGGVESPEPPANVNGRSIVVASAQVDAGEVRLTWPEAVAASESAHRTMLEVLRAE